MSTIRLIAIRLLLASGLVYLLLPVFANRWAEIPFMGTFIDPNVIISGTSDLNWQVTPPDPPLAYPERVLAIDGILIADSRQLYNYLQEQEIGTTVTLSLEQPPLTSRVDARAYTGQRTATARLIPFRGSQLWSEFWLFYLVGLITFFIGAWTFRARPHAPMAQIFAAMAATMAWATGTLFDIVTAHYFVRVWVVAICLSAPLLLLFALNFPHKNRLVNRWPILNGIILTPSFIVIAWGQWWLYYPSDPWAYVKTWHAAYALVGIYAVLALGVMLYRSNYSPSPSVRQQVRLVLLGTAVSVAPSLLFFARISFNLPGLDWMGADLFIPPLVIFPLTIAYVIIRYRLLNVDLIVRRGVTYTLISIFLFGSLILIITGLSPYIPITSPFLLAGLVVAVALLFDPLRQRLQSSIDQVLFRKPSTFSDLLRMYNRQLTTAVTADEISQVLFHNIKQALPGTTPQLYLPEANGYVNVNGHNQGVFLDMDSPVIDFLRKESSPLDLTERRTWPQTLELHRASIEPMQAAVLVPMNTRNKLLGWLTLSEKNNKQNYTQAELTYLGALANQSLIGLERANVVRRLQSRIEELDAISHFSQMLNHTIVFDDMLELIFVNYNRMLGVDNFMIALFDPDTQLLHPVFHSEKGERLSQREGRKHVIRDKKVLETIKMGQMSNTSDENGRSWLIAPLKAGADTLGAVYTTYWEFERSYNLGERQLFNLFADRAAVALNRLQTNQMLKERAQQLETINQVTVSLAQTLELDPLLDLILDKAIELLVAEAGSFMLLLEDTGELEFSVVRGPAGDDLVGTRLPIGTGLAGTAAQTGRPILVNRAQDDKRWFANVSVDTHFQTEAILTVPLMRHNTVRGVLQIINKRNGGPFDEDDQQLLVTFAGQAVVALENARLLAQTDEALQLRVNELSMLQQLDRDVNMTLDLHQVMRLTLDWTLRICKGTSGGILLLDERGEPTLQATHGYDDAFDLSDSNRRPLSDGLMGQVIENGKPHITGNVHQEPNYVVGSTTTHSQLTLPILYKEQMLGVIAIESDAFDAFDDSVVETAVRVTNHAAVALANAQLYAQVQAANHAKSEFVSMVSHELKTPMTAIGGYTSLLLKGVAGEITEAQQNFLETIEANLRRMARQIQDLTDISRIETEGLYIETVPIRFADIVHETLQSVQGACDEKNIQLHIDLPADLPLIQADQGRLVQVLTNLISNACKYSPPDTEVTITFLAKIMAVAEDKEAEPMVVCSVKDSGYGISEADQQKLFTKFFRASDPNIRKASGTGLGLSITKGLVELHGGKIWYESALGNGTTFHFAIPQAKEPA